MIVLVLLPILLIFCLRKPTRQKVAKHQKEEDKVLEVVPNYDTTQENVQTVELQEDPLANVRLLTPTLPGGCNDENAAKEAAARHKSNQYFPKFEIQKLRIINSTTPEELKKMVDNLPFHPPQMYRKELKETSVDEQINKWKDVHVNWHEKGIVFIVRSLDTCRAKDDGPGDTVESPNVENEKINSEMVLSDRQGPTPSRKPSLPASKKTSLRDDKKLDGTQTDTIRENEKTPQAPTVTPQPPSAQQISFPLEQTPVSNGLTPK